jgi:hypothetical protein
VEERIETLTFETVPHACSLAGVLSWLWATSLRNLGLTDKIRQIQDYRSASLSNEQRAIALEAHINNPPPDVGNLAGESWRSLCHLSAGLGCYRAALIAVWWRGTNDEGPGSGVERVDALWWTLDAAEASLTSAPLAGRLLLERLRKDHAQSAPSGTMILIAGTRQFGPVGFELCEIRPDLMRRAKTHFEWVLDNSSDVLHRKLATAWLTELLNDLYSWKKTAGYIQDGSIAPIDGIDVKQWIDHLDREFPQSKHQ